MKLYLVWYLVHGISDLASEMSVEYSLLRYEFLYGTYKFKINEILNGE